MQKAENVIVGMEPTGHYWKPLANYLFNQNIKVVVVNSFHVKKAKELDDNSPTKNDKKDALTIARLIKDGRYNEVYMPEGIYADLRNISNTRFELIRKRNEVKNRVIAIIDEYFPEYGYVFKDKFCKTSIQILKNCPFPEDIKLKELNFLEVFDNFSNDYNWTFGDNKEFIKYFGINNASSEELNKNIEVLFYNKISNENLFSNDMAIKLKTKEGDEIILYRTDEQKSFDEYYNDIQVKANQYTGTKEFSKDDELRIPYIRINGIISYNELYDKEIKNSEGLCIYDVIQNVNFSLNEKGCNLSSKATMVTEYLSASLETKYCYFNDTFIVFMKEQNSDRPYFALKVDGTDILEKKEETDEPKITDQTMMADSDKYKVLDGEYKFFEDENYEYYYPTQKTKLVEVWFKNGDIMTAEEALKQGKITMELLDKYGVEYIKREK